MCAVRGPRARRHFPSCISELHSWQKAESSFDLVDPESVRSSTNKDRTRRTMRFWTLLVNMAVRLCLTVTFLGDLVELVPGGTFALEGPHRVDAVSSLTDAGDGLALVHVCTHTHDRKLHTVNTASPGWTSFIKTTNRRGGRKLTQHTNFRASFRNFTLNWTLRSATADPNVGVGPCRC